MNIRTFSVRPDWQKDSLAGLLLIVVTLLIYWPVTRCDFVNLDDQEYVTENARVQAGLTLGNAGWAFTTGHAGNWHPLTWLSLMLDVNLFGAKAAGFHFTNLMLHAASAVLLFALLRRLTGARWRSALVAAGFAWHPLTVESVAWVAERKNVLSTCLGFLSLLFYANYARRATDGTGGQKPGWLASPAYWLAWGAYGLGLLSKPMLVTWPFVMLLLDYWPLARWKTGRAWPLVLEKIPFLALAAGASVVTMIVQQHGNAVESLPWDARGGNALVSYCRYLGSLLWPLHLAVFYPYPGYWPLATVLLAGTFLGGVTLWLWKIRREQPYMLMGWLWFGGTLIPVIGLVQVGGQAMADRYTYVPVVGLLIMVVWGAFALGRHWRFPAAILPVSAAAALLICAGLTRQQLGYWQNSQRLFEHALAETRNNWFALNGLGAALDQKGRTEEAGRLYEQALRLNPDYADAHFNLGNTRYRQGQTAEAIFQYQQALRFKPNFTQADNELGTALAKAGRGDEAIQRYELALRLNPDYAEARNNLGAALETSGQCDAAIHQYELALLLKPDYVADRLNLGTALDKEGRDDEAMSQYQILLGRNPENAEAHNNLGLDLARQSQFDPAAAQFEEALRLEPDYADADNNLGYLWVQQNEHLEQALGLIRHALKLEPQDPETLDSLGCVLGKLNHPVEALDYQRQAVSCSPQPDATLYDHLGDAYAALSRPELAAEAWRKSLAISPNPHIQKKLAGLPN